MKDLSLVVSDSNNVRSYSYAYMTTGAVTDAQCLLQQAILVLFGDSDTDLAGKLGRINNRGDERSIAQVIALAVDTTKDKLTAYGVTDLRIDESLVLVTADSIQFTLNMQSIYGNTSTAITT